MIICDTNIIIELFKNNSTVIAECESIGYNNLALSVITAGELYHGALDKNELKKIQSHLSKYILLELNPSISQLFLQLMQKYSLSHKCYVDDILIAATALHFDKPLYTLNLKDFRFISGLKIYKS